MSEATSGLGDLRRAIDTIDDELHALIVRRGALAADVARGKRETPLYRPAREAAILRRLLARHDESRDKAAIAAVWRAIIAASFARQGELRIVADVAVEWQAMMHFCPRARNTAPGPLEAISLMLEGAADLAVLRSPGLAGGGAWIARLIEARRRGVAVYLLGRLPFLATPETGREEALVLGRGVPEPSGQDVTLVAALVPPPDAAQIWFGRLERGLSLHAFEGYVKADDARLAGAVWLGVYPRPLGPDGLRPIPFDLSP